MTNSITSIQTAISSYERSAQWVTADMKAMEAAIASSSAPPVVLKTEYLNVENGVTLGSPSKPVVLIAEGMNTNKDMTITINGTLIVKQSLNGNQKLDLNVYQAATLTFG